jgi:hypothetical protein
MESKKCRHKALRFASGTTLRTVQTWRRIHSKIIVLAWIEKVLTLVWTSVVVAVTVVSAIEMLVPRTSSGTSEVWVST